MMTTKQASVSATPPKYSAERAEKLDKNRVVIILTEKHATSYYDPRDWGGYLKLCLHIFTTRFKSGHYYPPHAPSEPKAPPTVEKDVMDKDFLAVAAKREKEYKRKMREYEEEMDEWSYIEAASKGNEWAAEQVLTLRRDYEYESFDVEILETP